MLFGGFEMIFYVIGFLKWYLVFLYCYIYLLVNLSLIVIYWVFYIKFGISIFLKRMIGLMISC